MRVQALFVVLSFVTRTPHSWFGRPTGVQPNGMRLGPTHCRVGKHSASIAGHRKTHRQSRHVSAVIRLAINSQHSGASGICMYNPGPLVDSKRIKNVTLGSALRASGG
jgi:hypothetical protein